MYAIIESGSHQLKARQGDVLTLDLLDAKPGDVVTIDKVTALIDEKSIEFGTPYLAGVSVKAEVLGESKGKKIRILRFKRRKRIRIHKGHRQKYSEVKVLEIQRGEENHGA